MRSLNNAHKTLSQGLRSGDYDGHDHQRRNRCGKRSDNTQGPKRSLSGSSTEFGRVGDIHKVAGTIPRPCLMNPQWLGLHHREEAAEIWHGFRSFKKYCTNNISLNWEHTNAWLLLDEEMILILKVNVKLPLFLIKYNAMRKYGGVEV
jgi:hypothetical protein